MLIVCFKKNLEWSIFGNILLAYLTSNTKTMGLRQKKSKYLLMPSRTDILRAPKEFTSVGDLMSFIKSIGSYNINGSTLYHKKWNRNKVEIFNIVVDKRSGLPKIKCNHTKGRYLDVSSLSFDRFRFFYIKEEDLSFIEFDSEKQMIRHRNNEELKELHYDIQRKTDRMDYLLKSHYEEEESNE